MIDGVTKNDLDAAARLLLRAALRAAAEPQKLLWTPREASIAISVSEKTLWSNTAPRGACIPSIVVGERSRRYSVAALQKWIDAQPMATACAPEVNGDNEE
jgi:hypothetical protein